MRLRGWLGSDDLSAHDGETLGNLGSESTLASNLPCREALYGVTYMYMQTR